jgi:SAM-dependent MidA family methyltransferase
VAAAGLTTDGLVELLVPAPPDVAAEATRLVRRVDDLADGARIPLPRAAASWLAQALATVEAGRVIVVDYADTTGDLARRPWAEWLRTFRRHQAALSPLASPGTQDITCVVAWDQLAAVAPPDDNTDQADWLSDQGLGGLVEAAQAHWRERAGVGDLAALAARSRVHEAQALTDRAGLGSHRVLQWVVH